MSISCQLAFPPEQGEEVECILKNAKTIAVVGLSARTSQPSHRVASYLQRHGFKIIPVNPKCDEVLGEKSYPDLKSIPEHIDIVDIFRNVEAIPGIVDEAIEVGADVVWMQSGLQHEESAEKARRAGLHVVMNSCMKTQHSLLNR